MTIVVETQVPPEFEHVVDWLERTAQQEGVRKAQEMAQLNTSLKPVAN